MVLLIVMRWVGVIATSFWLTNYGSSACEKTKIELRSKGEKLTFKELLPSAPPDSGNFFADPMWRQMYDFVSVKEGDHFVKKLRTPKEQWIIRQPCTPLSVGELDQIKRFIPSNSIPSPSRDKACKLLRNKLIASKDPNQRRDIAKTILKISTPADPLLARIAELLKRPSASFPLHYEDHFATPMPHVIELLGLGQLLGTKSVAELEMGDTRKAKSDLQMILGLSGTLRDEPVLIALLVSESLIAITMQPGSNSINGLTGISVRFSEV